MHPLRISDSLALPVDAITQTFLVVGKRGSGKSNTAVRLVEQFHRAHLPFVVLDVTDTWWGLKAGVDGGPGLKDVYIFGGRKQDLPLEPGGGALLAEVLCEHHLPMVLSVKHLTGRERSTFMVAFAQTLFQKWGGGPLHVVLEEAHELAPQSTQNAKEGEQQMLGAFKRLWKLGRASGIGGTAVTQRPASLSKDITTQSEVLIAHKTIGPQDVKAIGEWIKYHGERLDILGEIPTLKAGEAFIWAPEFPTEKPIGLKRMQMLRRETYDSASTPKVGERRVEPKELAPVDLERLRTKMTATIERAKAEDPRELRRQVADLKRQLAETEKRKAPAAPAAKTVEVSALTAKDRAAIEKAAGRFETAATRLERAASLASDAIQSLESRLEENVQRGALIQATAARDEARRLRELLAAKIAPATRGPVLPAGPRTPPPAPAERMPPRSVPARSAVSTNGDRPSMKKCLRSLLTVLALHPDGCSAGKLTLLAGYHWSGNVRNELGAGRANGWIAGSNAETMRITEEGLNALGPVDPLPTGSELARYWLEHPSFKLCARKLLAAFLAHRAGLDAERICRETGYEWSGNVRNELGALRTAGLIIGKNTETMRAVDDLFD